MNIKSIFELPTHEILLILTFIFYSLHLLTKVYMHRNLSNVCYGFHFGFSVLTSVSSSFLFASALSLPRLLPLVFFMLMISFYSISVNSFYRLIYVIEENDKYYETENIAKGIDSKPSTGEDYSVKKEQENYVKYLFYTGSDGKRLRLYFNYRIKIKEDCNDFFDIMYSKKRRHRGLVFIIKRSYTEDGMVVFAPPSEQEYNDVLKKINITPAN